MGVFNDCTFCRSTACVSCRPRDSDCPRLDTERASVGRPRAFTEPRCTIFFLFPGQQQPRKPWALHFFARTASREPSCTLQKKTAWTSRRARRHTKGAFARVVEAGSARPSRPGRMFVPLVQSSLVLLGLCLLCSTKKDLDTGMFTTAHETFYPHRHFIEHLA
jgi:hypothetical protein